MRVPRKERTGMAPVTAGVIALAVLAVGTYFGFTKAIPFRHDFRLNAVFRTANNIKPDSPVRIAGVDVGKVTKIKRYKDSDAALVTMELEDNGLPVHKDATVKIRPRIFLEGNFFLDLRPGTPSAPKLEDDDAPLPMTQTAAPVQLDQVLTALQRDPREDLQDTLVNLGDALNGKPSAAEDADQDPDVRGETAAESVQNSYTYSADALRNAAQLNDAFQGTEPRDLSKLIAGLQKVTAALGRNELALQDLVTNFNTTMGALASEQSNVRASIRELAPTLAQANTTLDSLNRAFPPTRAFAREILPGVRESPETIDATLRWIPEVRALLDEDELRGLVRELRPATRDSAALIDATLRLLRQVDPVNRCVLENVLPSGDIVIQEGNLTTGVPNYKEFWYTMVGLAGEGQNFDGNGMYVRFQPGGGSNTVGTGRTAFGGDELFGNASARPLGTRPAYPGKRPPYRPDVPCFTQPVPDLNAAQTGPPADRPVSRSAPAPGVRRDEAPGTGIGERLLRALEPLGEQSRKAAEDDAGGEGGR